MGKRILAVAVVVASACTALHYSTTEQHAVTISNNPYPFGGPGSQVFVVSPQGSGDHNVLESIELSPNCSSQWRLDTSIDAQQPVMGANVCSFGPGSGSGSTFFTGDQALACPRNYQFAVSFAGTLPGVDACAVDITSVPSGSTKAEVYTLSLTGSGSGGTGITASPTQVDFNVPVSTTSSPAEITVKNNGSASVSVAGSLSGGPFQITPSLGSPIGIGPGSSATYQVTCTPPSLGAHSGTITFYAGSATAMTTLDCNGNDSMVRLAPTQVAFANTLVGRSPPDRSVVITGDALATIDTVELDAAATTAGVTIVTNPQGSRIGTGQTVVLASSAAAMHAAGPLGTLSIAVTGESRPLTVSISGQALIGGVGTNPASVELGAVCIGGSFTRSIEVYANEPGDVVLQQLTKPAAPFDAMIVDTLPKTLAGNHTGPSAMVRATLTPTMPGEFADAIVLASDVPNKPTTEVTLRGIGVAAGIAATPDVVHFGAAAAGSTTSIKEVQLTNCGTGELMFAGATITGTHASEFTLIGSNPPRTLLPTESETFMVVMQPDTGGFKIAQLVLQHSAGTTAVDLDGNGDGATPGETERETYYACSTGRGTALWPIALALLALRRRRR